MDRPDNGTKIFFIPQLENIRFDLLYDHYIAKTDTRQLIDNISTETLEAFLYQTAKYFYGCRRLSGETS